MKKNLTSGAKLVTATLLAALASANIAHAAGSDVIRPADPSGPRPGAKAGAVGESPELARLRASAVTAIKSRQPQLGEARTLQLVEVAANTTPDGLAALKAAGEERSPGFGAAKLRGLQIVLAPAGRGNVEYVTFKRVADADAEGLRAQNDQIRQLGSDTSPAKLEAVADQLLAFNMRGMLDAAKADAMEFLIVELVKGLEAGKPKHQALSEAMVAMARTKKVTLTLDSVLRHCI